MVEVNYPYRLLCDSDFLIWLSTQTDKESLLSFLIHIKSSSMHWKKQHNSILESEAKNCQADSGITEKYLGAAFKKIPDPEYLGVYALPTTKNIIYAIEIASDIPYNCYLLTSPEREVEYKDNPHLKGITSVQVVSGEVARRIINNFYGSFSIAREAARTGVRS